MMSMLDSDSDFDNYSETSDSEDQDDRESTYGGNAQCILSSLDESMEKIDDFLAYGRGFVHGDFVRTSTDPSGQLGRVMDVDIVVDLETTSGELIKDVNSKKLLKLRSFAPGDYVAHGPWLGRVSRVCDVVTVLFNDGTRCEIMTGDADILMPVSRSSIEDVPYPYYPGQRVKINLSAISKTVRWLCGSWNIVQDEGTVCTVEVGSVHVNWIASAMDSKHAIPSPSALQDPKNLTLLVCFPYVNWQLGDWCTLPSGYLTNSSSSSIAPQFISRMQKLGMDDQYCKEMFVIVSTKSKVDVLWQNGDCSVVLDPHSLLPVNSIGDHDFWLEQFVLEKVALEDANASSVPRLGIVKHVDAQEQIVKVKWRDPNGGSSEEMVSAYELIEHPDFSYNFGDVVLRLLPHYENSEWHDMPLGGVLTRSVLSERSTLKDKHIDEGHAEHSTAYLSHIGNVIGFKDDGVEVRWATGLTSMVQPFEIFGLDRLESYASIATVNAEAVPENAGKEISEQEKQPSLKKEKAAKDSDKVCEKDVLDSCSLFSHFSSIGFLGYFAKSLFGPGGSSSLLSRKNIPEFQVLKSEEENLDVNDLELESLKQHEEKDEVEDITRHSPGNKEVGMFKQFDIVDDYSNHHFASGAGKGLTSQVKIGWLKKVQKEWGILKKDLPDSIYVRVYEERIDLLRACIVGAPGTPYHDGLFFFDISFPHDYPNQPPLVHYISGGLRLNPNLYESGKVCLSLLKTWMGTGTEEWNPESSTILQVLLSLQALVLNEKPYFNEAGYDKQMGRAEGEKNSVAYNENAFLLSCKSMLYLLRNPPKHFEELVEEHFARRSQSFLLACKAYMDGAQVGFPWESGRTEGDGGNGGCSTGFKIMLSKLIPKLAAGFTEKGIDCSEFLK